MKNAYLKHFITVCKHKHYVFKECVACGLFWQGLVHDLSKFSPTEFISSARYFQGNRSPIDAEKEAIGYSAAWLHHKGHNKHHWEYWTDFDKYGEVIANKIPMKYVIEMVCDYVGAGKAYAQDKWTKDAPWNYFVAKRAGRHYNCETEATLIYLLTTIKTEGLSEFHTEAKRLLKEK